MDMTPYLKLMVEKNASDIFITTDAPVKIKLEGVITSVGKTILTGDICKAAAYNIMSDIQAKHFEETMECDFAIALEDGSARFRVNVFRQRGEVGLVLRLIPSEIPTVEQLGLPEILNEMILHKRGLILMVGGTGSGKSTTLAAMINHRNRTRSQHETCLCRWSRIRSRVGIPTCLKGSHAQLIQGASNLETVGLTEIDLGFQICSRISIIQCFIKFNTAFLV